jgi:hypothetical protein
MDVPEVVIGPVFESLGVDVSTAAIEALSTLPHSRVYRITLGDRRRVILKHAGAAEFAEGMRKELVVNRDVVAKLPRKVAPALLDGSAEGGLPWLLFEDISVSHHSVSAARPPAFEHIRKFVQALATSHAQSARLDLADLFSEVNGDIRVTDGSEGVAGVLDRFLHEVEADRFPPRSYDLIRKIRDNVPRIIELLSGQSVLIHGDAHFGNALYADDALLLDWALAVIGPGEVDLCHAVAMNLPRYFASEYESAVVGEYVRTCCDLGQNVGEHSVMDRYRRCLLLTVIVATGMKSVAGIQDRVWSYLFTNAVHSAIDHDSASFLG